MWGSSRDLLLKDLDLPASLSKHQHRIPFTPHSNILLCPAQGNPRILLRPLYFAELAADDGYFPGLFQSGWTLTARAFQVKGTGQDSNEEMDSPLDGTFYIG
jgi:hypothetical protein